ncbi:MAG: ATP-binding cassette domain-containing protein [Lachnospiraceae bacterium]|nr:ATP-binding cassette domain-containing protein [Lachnospiraceae bacterium]
MIEIKNYTKKIRGKVILDDVNLTFEEGHIYGLKGVNGSGKTMLMRAVAGLMYSMTGQVVIDGKVLGKDMDFPPSIGLLLENPAFLGNMTGFENLKFLASLKGNISDEEIKDVIAKVGLDPEDKRKYSKYSLGMKQRLGIAQALVGSPKIIILDEPFNALDEDGIELISPLIKETAKNGSTVIMACHDSEQLTALAEKIIVIYEGKIKEK